MNKKKKKETDYIYIYIYIYICVCVFVYLRKFFLSHLKAERKKKKKRKKNEGKRGKKIKFQNVTTEKKSYKGKKKGVGGTRFIDGKTPFSFLMCFFCIA